MGKLRLKLGHGVIRVAEELPEASRRQHWVAPFLSNPLFFSSNLVYQPRSVLISAKHENMSYSSPSCGRQLVLYTFYTDFSLLTGRANIGHSGKVEMLADNLGNKQEKEEKRLRPARL